MIDGNLLHVISPLKSMMTYDFINYTIYDNSYYAPVITRKENHIICKITYQKYSTTHKNAETLSIS